MIVLLVVVGTIVVYLVIGAFQYKSEKLPPAASYAHRRSAKENARLLARSINLFQLGLADPMYTQTQEYKTSVEKIINEYMKED